MELKKPESRHQGSIDNDAASRLFYLSNGTFRHQEDAFDIAGALPMPEPFPVIIATLLANLTFIPSCFVGP